MKKSVAILLLLCIGAGPLYQLGYFTYYKLNMEYLIEEYCINKDKEPTITVCNARCHLAQQFSATDNCAEDQDMPSSRIKEVLPLVYFQRPPFDWNLFLEDVNRSGSEGIYNHYFSRVKQVPVPPPKV